MTSKVMGKKKKKKEKEKRKAYGMWKKVMVLLRNIYG